jgi:hypothetical protein
MYISGEIAGNTSQRGEPAMRPLAESFAQIQKRFGERFKDTFMDEFGKLARIMVAQYWARRRQDHRDPEQVLELWDPERSNAPNKWEALPEPKPTSEKPTLPKQPAPPHKPRHDVESVFWVLVGCLVRALPDGADDHPTERSDIIFNDMLYHEIPPSESNRRDEALRWSREVWERALHPRLQMLAPMIVRMCDLLCINWRDRSTQSNRFLLHQGFKRLLFMQIQEMEEDIRLNTKKPKTVYASKPGEVRKTLTNSALRASGCSSSQDSPIHQIQRPKRGSDSITGPGETTSSRKRAKLGPSAQVPQPTQPDSSPQPPDDLFDGSLTPLSSEVEPPEETGSPPLARRMGAPMQLGTEGTVDDDGEEYEKRSQEDVDKKANKAIDSMPEALKKTIVQHKRRAESLVKMHLDDEAWHQVAVKRDPALNALLG